MVVSDPHKGLVLICRGVCFHYVVQVIKRRALEIGLSFLANFCCSYVGNTEQPSNDSSFLSASLATSFSYMSRPVALQIVNETSTGPFFLFNLRCSSV